MTDVVDFLDDPNDPAPELAMLEELEKNLGIGRYKNNDENKNISANENFDTGDERPLSNEELLAKFGIEPTYEEPMEFGIPRKEYLRRFRQYLIDRNWNALAEMLHTNVDHTFIRTFERMRDEHGIKS